MRRALPLLLVGLAGCWPYIPGSWEDYAVPDQTEVLGQAWWNQFDGEYWVDGSASGAALWGWLDEPSTTVTALDWVASGTDCEIASPSWDGLLALLGDLEPEEDSAVLTTPGGDLEMSWFAQDRVFYGDLSSDQVAYGEDYGLEPLATGAAGELHLPGFMRTPGDLELEGPDFDQSSPPTLAPGDLAWTWRTDHAGAPAEWVVVTAYLQDEDQGDLETAVCAVPYADGELEIPPDLWTRDGAGWLVAYGSAREVTTRIGEGDTASRTLFVRQRIGYALVE